MTLELKVGGVYRTRNGIQKSIIAKKVGLGFTYPWRGIDRCWMDDGRFSCCEYPHPLDLIAEWEDEPAEIKPGMWVTYRDKKVWFVGSSMKVQEGAWIERPDGSNMVIVPIKDLTPWIDDPVDVAFEQWFSQQNIIVDKVNGLRVFRAGYEAAAKKEQVK